MQEKTEDKTQNLLFYQLALHHKGHSHSKDDAAAAEIPAAATDAAATNGTASNTTNATNVVGKVSGADTIVNAYPYEIKRCDQVLQVTAQRIPNFDDYTSRSPAFFTLSAYLMNMFESQDSSKLLESVSLGHIQALPEILKGSKDCLLFKDGITSRNISLCPVDEEQSDAVRFAYEDFMKCRMGSTLKEFDPVTVNNVLTASCNGNPDGDYDLPQVREIVSNDLKSAGFNVLDTSIHGSADLGVTKDGAGVISPTPPRKIDYTVPGSRID